MSTHEPIRAGNYVFLVFHVALRYTLNCPVRPIPRQTTSPAMDAAAKFSRSGRGTCGGALDGTKAEPHLLFAGVGSLKLRAMVLGASGMLGHKLLQRLSSEFDVAGTLQSHELDRAVRDAVLGIPLYPDVHAEDLAALEHAIDDWRPDVVVNCIGIVKQAPEAVEHIASISINALFPHQAHLLAAKRGTKFIHFSTDCVFSGRHGDYKEDDIPDPTDLYGRSKLLGEVTGRGALTLRTSIVGRELRGHRGLIEWCLGQRGKQIRGYTRALYNGLTTGAMADLVAEIIRSHAALEGLWHVSSDPISKFDLLRIVNRVYELKIDIERDDEFVCDRRLNSARFRNEVGWRPKTWQEMIATMRSEGLQ
jgi:dTDP-4-dehydrorhamnose reductase